MGLMPLTSHGAGMPSIGSVLHLINRRTANNGDRQAAHLCVVSMYMRCCKYRGVAGRGKCQHMQEVTMPKIAAAALLAAINHLHQH